jgi:hypothetical protein
MNIRKNNITKRRRTRPFIIFFISYSLLIYVTQIFYKDSLFNASLYLTSMINKNEGIQHLIPYLEEAANFFGTFQFYGILTLFIFNSANIYKTFIFIVSILLSIFISAWLKLIYQQPLMFYSDHPEYVINPLFCEGTWGNPSTNSTTSTCVFLTFWKIVFDCGRLRFKNNTKIISLICLFLIIILLNSLKFLAALHSIDQLLFGILIGFQIFFFLFYVVRVDLNNGKDLSKLVTFKIGYYILINAILLISFLLTFYLNDDPKKREKFENNLNLSDCGHKLSPNVRFSKDALLLAMIFFSNIGIFIGMKYELKYVFNSNEFNWRQYNFNKEDSEEESLFSKLSISKDTQWNHTSCFFSILRLFATFIFHTIIFLPMFLIGSENNLAIVIMFKIIVPLTISSFFMFSIEKVILYKLSLTNDSIFSLLSDSL